MVGAVDDQHRGVRPGELTRRRESGKAGADDDDDRAVRRSVAHQLKRMRPHTTLRSGMPATVRPARFEDAPAWRRMRRRIGAEWALPEAEREIERFFETGLIDHLPHAVFIAEDDGRPVGLAEVR